MLIDNYTIVLSRYNEDISWCDGFKNILVYNKGRPFIAKHNIRYITNIGHESHTYLTYILEHYYKLPDVVCFFQAIPHIDNFIGRPISGAETEIVEKFVNLKSFSSGNYENKPFNFGLSPDFRIGAYPIGQPLVLHDTDGYTFFKECINSEVNIYNLNIYFGGNFSVKREAILSRPIEYYFYLWSKFRATHCELGHFFERSWYYIFNLHKFNEN